MKYEFLNKDIHNGFAYKPVAVLKPYESKKSFDVVEMVREWSLPTIKTAMQSKSSVMANSMIRMIISINSLDLS